MYICNQFRTLQIHIIRKEAYYERELILADRDLVETESDAILQDAAEVDVSLLVVGDPFG
jgi:diphthine methyl ester synthase